MVMPPPLSTVLVTGGAGFIGSNLVRQWLAEESDFVVTLDALTYAGLRESLGDVLDHARHELVVGDIRDAALIRDLLTEYRPRVVLHLAAESHVDRSIVEPLGFVQTNVLGTTILLEESTRWWLTLPNPLREDFRFVQISTDEVFGSAAAGEQFTAASPLTPNSPYAASKAAAEHLARAYACTYGLPVVTLNPGNHYGPRQLPEKLIPKMILLADAGQPLPLYGDGLHERDWIHVEDGCRAIRAAAARGEPGRRYLIGGDNCRPNRKIVELICDELDRLRADGGNRRRLLSSVTDRPGHDRRYAVDAKTAQQQLDWRPQIDLAAGLRGTVGWYLSNPEWVAAANASLQRRDAG